MNNDRRATPRGLFNLRAAASRGRIATREKQKASDELDFRRADIQFIDRAANEIVWSGTVTQILDQKDKGKSLELASKAVAKLLKRFPPANSKSK